MKDSVLEIKNVSKYFGRKKVLDNISLDVKSGEIYGFLGPNGAGKTTTIKMILGLLYIDEGEIKINGYSVKKEFEKAMTYIGGIVENPDLYGYMSGLDNLKLYARIRNVDKNRIDEVVKLVNLEKRINEKVSKYSLGMKQRLGLALTLLHSPRVLILDEPTNGLDPAGIKDLRNILKNIAINDNVAVFISSHLLSEMELMCDKVAVIENGKLIKVENLKKDENEVTTYIADYVLETADIEETMQILQKESIELKIQKEDNKVLLLKIDKEKVPFIIKTLVDNNVKIYQIAEKSQSLEDVFFGVTEGGNNNE